MRMLGKVNQVCLFGVWLVARSNADGGLDKESFRLDILSIVSIK